MEVGMSESPTLLAKLAVVWILDFMKVVFVELANKGGKIGVFEHAREDGLCKIVHVLDDEAVAARTP